MPLKRKTERAGKLLYGLVGVGLAASYCRSGMFGVSSLNIVRRAPSL
jgi:hypothetical protein